jgi:hypothetical protein
LKNNQQMVVRVPRTRNQDGPDWRLAARKRRRELSGTPHETMGRQISLPTRNQRQLDTRTAGEILFGDNKQLQQRAMLLKRRRYRRNSKKVSRSRNDQAKPNDNQLSETQIFDLSKSRAPFFSPPVSMSARSHPNRDLRSSIRFHKDIVYSILSSYSKWTDNPPDIVKNK